jgi:hypothetical protein
MHGVNLFQLKSKGKFYRKKKALIQKFVKN